MTDEQLAHHLAAALHDRCIARWAALPSEVARATTMHGVDAHDADAAVLVPVVRALIAEAEPW